MGMYTELNCAFSLKEDTTQQVIDTLKYMAEGGDQPELPEHPLFSLPRWRAVLTGDSYYFDGDTHSTVRYDDISKQYHVTIRANLKNYDGEIDRFILWVTPYIDKFPGDFIGYKRYEEREIPTLLFHPNQWREVTLSEPLNEAA